MVDRVKITEWKRLHGPGSLVGTFSLTIGDEKIEGVEIYKRNDGAEWVRFPDTLQRRVLAALNTHLGLAA